MFSKSRYKHDLKFRPDFETNLVLNLFCTSKVAALNSNELVNRCVCPNYTQVYFLVNTFIVVFPLKLIQDKRKQRQWSREECMTEFTADSSCGDCALGFSSKWRKDLALLKFGGRGGRPR